MAKKNTSYFQHDSNAREDDKLVALRMKHGSAGYGVYFMLLEVLSTSDDFRYKRDYNKLGYVLHERADLIKNVVEGYGLFQFTDEGELFYSTRLSQHMEAITDSRVKMSEAGRRGNEKRWGKTPQPDSNPIGNPIATQSLPNRVLIADKIREDNKRVNSLETRAHAEGDDENFSSEVLETKKIYDELRAELTGDTMRAEAAERFAKIPRAKIAEYLDQFQAKLSTEGITAKSRGDYQRHFTSWLKIQLDRAGKQPGKPSSDTYDRLHPKPLTGGYSTDF